MNNPLSFCVLKDSTGLIKEIYYGEYIWNKDKGPVSIYKYDMKNWSVVYSFDKGLITHIHSVNYDAYHKRFIILTGDEDEESAIWEANSDFSSVRRIVGGSQIYRSCICFPTNDGIYYVTDSPSYDNFLLFLNNNCELKRVSPINGPCIYGIIHDNVFIFSTSVEGDFSLGRFRYKITNKLAKGIKDRFVHIYVFNFKEKLSEIAKFKKDSLPMWLFQFGNAFFVNGDDSVFFYTQSTRGKGTYKITTN